MKIQWYPGHMTKAKRAMSDAIKLVDIIIEMTDARAPEATRNPEITGLGMGKSRIIILNKADLADENANIRWASYYKEKGYECMFMDSRQKNGVNSLIKAIENVSKDKRERDAKRGIKNRPVRAMVAGIPNVGKSTLINTVSGRAMAKTGNKPGVTKGKQWIRLNKQVELLDTPGILWPKFEDRKTAEHLAFIGSIKDEVIEKMELVLNLITELEENYEGLIASYYGFDNCEKTENKIDFAVKTLEAVAEKRALLKKGGETDTDKASKLILDDFKNGRLGKITLENVGE